LQSHKDKDAVDLRSSVQANITVRIICRC
jgi:hypothetical protein